jgi:hypothetical protein
MYTNSQIYEATKVLLKEGAVRISAIAQGAEISEQDVTMALINEAANRNAVIQFRYPPIPEGAVLGITEEF